MSYIGWDGMEYEDLEWDRMRHPDDEWLEVEGPFRTLVEAESAQDYEGDTVSERWNCGTREYFVVRHATAQMLIDDPGFIVNG